MSVKYAGVPVRIGGQEYIVPSLSVAQFIDNYDELTKPVTAGTRDEFSARVTALVPIIGLALRRNYPEITDDFLQQELDLVTFPSLVIAIQAASGLKPVTELGE